MFTRCGACNKRKQLRDAHLLGSTAYVFYAKVFDLYLTKQEVHRQMYSPQGTYQSKSPMKY